MKHCGRQKAKMKHFRIWRGMGERERCVWPVRFHKERKSSETKSHIKIETGIY